MARLTVSALLVFAFCFIASEAVIEPIWMAPTNLNYPPKVNATFNGDVFENFTANLGEWATIEVATGARGSRPLSIMDSKSIIWILGGSMNRPPSNLFTAVWNYNPKTDQYRYVWKSNDPSPFVARNAGELRVPSLSNHPGGLIYGMAAIDKDDNIWIFSYKSYGELWMFNTSSWMFVRQFGLDGNNDGPSVGANPGQPGEDVWPGQTEGQCLVIDSNNDVWILTGYNSNGYTNSVWHFNTTSFLWTFVTGSVSTVNGGVHNSTFYGGSWMSACDIDDNDRVWIFGGAALQGDYGDLYSFDTRTKREWEFESGEGTLDTGSQLVSPDYHSDNRPAASEGGVLIDRRDGTLMLVPGGVHTTDNLNFGNSNTVWQYSKSLKQWRLVYGTVSDAALNALGEYTNFRAPGSAMPAHANMAKVAGKNTNGDLYLIGGWLNSNIYSSPYSKDIWLIPQDQCSNNLFRCDVNAECVEEMIGYSCKCKDGFTCVTPSATPTPVPTSGPTTTAAPVTKTPSAKVSGSSSLFVSTFMSTLAIALLSIIAI